MLSDRPVLAAPHLVVATSEASGADASARAAAYLDKAEALLDEAGWIDRDNDGVRDKEIDGRSVPFEFSIVVNQQPLRIAICTLLKENLDQIGQFASARGQE